MGSTDSVRPAPDPTYPVVNRTGYDNHQANRLVHTRPAPSPRAVPISISVRTRSTSRSSAVLLPTAAPAPARHGAFGPYLHEIHGPGAATALCRAKSVLTWSFRRDVAEMFFQRAPRAGMSDAELVATCVDLRRTSVSIRSGLMRRPGSRRNYASRGFQDLCTANY